MKKVFLALILCWPVLARAADWHVRPAGSVYGTEAGTSYENAVAGNTGLAGLSPDPGDTIHLWGVHYEPFVIGFSGTAGNPVTIQFEDGAMVWPSVDETSGWSPIVGYDVYYKTVSDGYHYALWANDELVQPSPHDNSPSTRGPEAAAMQENTWRMRGSTELMFYAPGGVDPGTLDSVRVSDRTIDGTYGALDLRGQDYITIKDLNVRGARWNGGMPAAFVSDGDGISIIGGTVEHSERIAKVYGGADFLMDGLVADDLISTGISLLGATSDGTPVSNPLTSPTIRNSRITNVGYSGRYRGLDWSITGDNDAIGIGYEGGNVSGVTIEGNYFGNIGPQWAKDADVPSYFTSSDTDRGAGVYVGTAEVVPIDVTDILIKQNEFVGISRFAVHLGAECAGNAFVVSNWFHDTGRYVAFDGTVLVQGTENSNFYATVAHNIFQRALSRSSVILRQADADDSRRVVNNLFLQTDKVSDATGESWQGDVWRYTTGTWSPSIDVEDSNYHAPRDGLSSGILARDSDDETYSTLAAYRAATTYADQSTQDDPLFIGGSNPTTAEGFNTRKGSPLRAAGTIIGQRTDYNGRPFKFPPSIGAMETNSGDEAEERTLRYD